MRPHPQTTAAPPLSNCLCEDTFYFRAVPIPLTVRSATSFTNYFKQDAARKKATKKESAFSFLKNFTRACESMPSSMP